jgi:hypothetical protein
MPLLECRPVIVSSHTGEVCKKAFRRTAAHYFTDVDLEKSVSTANIPSQTIG